MNRKLVALTLATAVGLTGCVTVVKEDNTSKEIVKVGSKRTDVNVELTSNKEKVSLAEFNTLFGGTDNNLVSRQEPLYNVHPKQMFTFHFKSKEQLDPIRAVTIHTDSKCLPESQIFTLNYQYLTTDGSDIIVSPTKMDPVLNSVDRIENSDSTGTWGNAPIYYISINYDLESETTEKLEKSIVIPFTVANEVDTPTLTAYVDNDGNFAIKWLPVDDAEKYRIYRAPDVGNNQNKRKGLTRAEAGYIGERPELVAEVGSDVTEFKNFGIDGGSNTLQDSDGYTYVQNMYEYNNYYVTAVIDNDESQFSFEASMWKYGDILPESCDALTYHAGNYQILPSSIPVQMKNDTEVYMPVEYTLKEVKDSYNEAIYEWRIIGTQLTGCATLDYKDKESLKEYIAPMMNYTSSKEIDMDIPSTLSIDSKITEFGYRNDYVDVGVYTGYDEESLVKISKDTYYSRIDFENARLVNDGLIETSEITDSYISQDSYPTKRSDSSSLKYDEEVKDILKMSNNVVSEDNTVDNKIDSTTDNPTISSEENSVDEEKPEEITENTNVEVEEDITLTEYKIFADSPEEAYLANALINQQTLISLKQMPVLLDLDYCSDVLCKVIEQNPYATPIYDVYLFGNGEFLGIDYSPYVGNWEEKQAEIKKEADKIINNIIKDGMTDEEKIEAVWEYLENNTEYHHEAFEYAAEHNYEMDEAGMQKYADIFNAYGIMVDKVGVCSSYAYVMNILLEEAGVDVMRVTGYSGAVGHAWNIVTIDGNKYWIDATNTEKACGVPYLCYNTSGEIATEDLDYSLQDTFELDDTLKLNDMYITTKDDKDWYVQNGYIANSNEELVQLLIDNINPDGGTVSIRTHMDGNEINEFFKDEELLGELFSGWLNKGITEEQLYNMRCRVVSKYVVFIFD